MYVHDLSILPVDSRKALIEQQFHAITSNLSAQSCSDIGLEELLLFCDGEWFKSVSQLYKTETQDFLHKLQQWAIDCCTSAIDLSLNQLRHCFVLCDKCAKLSQLAKFPSYKKLWNYIEQKDKKSLNHICCCLKILIDQKLLSSISNDGVHICPFISNGMKCALSFGDRQLVTSLIRILVECIKSKVIAETDPLLLEVVEILESVSIIDDAAAISLYLLVSNFFNISHLRQSLLALLLKFLGYKSNKFVKKCALAALREVTKDVGVWTDFSLLFETLEEPQSHLVKPILGKFDKLLNEIENGTGSVNGALSVTSEFIEILFSKAFNHQNGWIRFWAIEKFINLEPCQLQYSVQFMFTHFLQSLSEDFYLRLSDEKKLETFISNVQNSLRNLLEFFDPSSKENFYYLWLDSTTKMSLSPVSFFYWTHICCDLINQPHWNKKEHFVAMRSVLSSCFSLPFPLLRAAIQQNLMIMFIQGTFWDNSNFREILPLIRLSRYDTIRLWSLISEWNIGDLSVKELSSFVNSCWPEDFKESDIFSKLLWTLTNNNKDFSDFVRSTLSEMLYNFEQRPYMDNKIVNRWITVWINNPACSDISFIGKYVVHRILNGLNQIDDLDTISQLYVPVLLECFDLSKLPDVLLSCLTKAQTLPGTCKEVLLLRVAGSLCDILQYESVSPNLTFELENILKWPKNLSSNTLQTFVGDKWRVWLCLNHSTENWKKALECCLMSLDIVVNDRELIVLFTVLRTILPQITEDTEIVRSLKAAYGCVLEQKQTEAYSGFVERFVQLMMLPSLLVKDMDYIHEMIDTLLLEAEICPFIACIITREFLKVIQNPAQLFTIDNWLATFVDLALFGPIPRNPDRIVYETAEFIMKSPYEYKKKIESYHQAAQKARLHALSVVQFLLNRFSSFNHRIISDNILDLCMERLDHSKLGSSRSFGLTFAHRYRTRGMQLLIMINSYLSQDSCEKLFSFCLSVFEDAGQQNSVKLLTELLLVQLIMKDKLFGDRFLNMDTELSNNRIGCISSWTTVLQHVARKTNDCDFLTSCISKFLSWTMAQNFPVRCTAIAALRLLNEGKLNENAMAAVKEKFAVVLPSIYFDLEQQGNAKRVIENLTEDFFFSVLDPIADCTLETIFYLIPLRTGLPVEELLSTELFDSQVSHTFMTLKNSNSSLAEAPYGLWKAARVPKQIEVNSNDEECFQKKLIPISLSDIEPDLRQQSSNTQTQSKQLIVIASLIDRATNLGGLCRTCEIFGATELVLNNKQVLKDQNFKSLSVTSEHWMSIKEVKIYQLTEYLNEMKSSGYKIVGAEQTTKSQSLDEFEFPAKTLLLLGNEKEGIPIDLMSLLDFTVEISQFGIIRSLNVHVSGALLIYEYTKQHKM